MEHVHYAQREQNRGIARRALTRVVLDDIAARIEASSSDGADHYAIAETVMAWELDAVEGLFDGLRACFAYDESGGEQPPALSRSLDEARALLGDDQPAAERAEGSL